MSNTVARVPVNGLQYRVEGALKKTITDVTVTTNSETVTAANLGLNVILSARAQVQTGKATDTGTYVTCAITAGGVSLVVAEFAAAGTAATTASTTVVRVYAAGH